MDGWTDVPEWSVLYKKLHHTQIHVSFQHITEHASPCASLHFPNLWLTLPDISLWLLCSAPLHNNTLFHYLVVLDPGLASERHLLEPPSAARGPTPSQCSVIPSTTPVCAQSFQVVGQEVICRHSFPGAPVPGDLGGNSGSCVSWHSMARLQPCTEAVSCTGLSALCSAYRGAGSRPSLRLCRPPLAMAKGEERAQPPAEYLGPQPTRLPGGL